MQYFLDNILDLFLPNQCIICQKISNHNLCSKCLSLIPNRPKLWIKANPSTQSIFLPNLNTILQKPLQESHLHSILTCTDFRNNVVRKSIHYIKYKNLPNLYKPLGTIMLRTLSQTLNIKENILLAPIPLHTNRIRFRGYNQALLLTKYLQSQLKLPIYTGLHRIKDTPHQMKIKDKYTRIQNITDAFEANHKASVANQHIILIDDVTTTLSTIEQAAKVLSKQGFTSINALVLAH